MLKISQNQLKKIITWCLVFCAVFNSIGFVWAGDAEIATYCEKQLGSGWSNFTYEPEISDFVGKTYNELNTQYHNEINNLFSTSIQKMQAIVATETDLKQVCTDKLISKKIQQGLTTYELSQKAICRYAKYKATLDAKLNYIATQNINDPDIQEILGEGSNLQQDTFQALQLFREKIETELEISRVSIDKTLAAYDEMILMYPLHLRFRCIISDLLTYRTHLAKLVNIFFCLERFINAASDKLD